MQTLIQTEQLKALVQQQLTRIFDCRFSLQDPAAGRAAYEKNHIKGAYFADMNQDLSTPHVPGVTGRHPLPQRADWINKVRSWGLTPDMTVVLYDDVGGAGASRFWWMLQWIGHEAACVLDGGWQAWLAADGAVDNEMPALPATAPDLYSQRQSLLQLLTVEDIDSAQQLLLDAREEKRFRGEVESIDPIAGHIPGAQCSPYSANLRADLSFKSQAELREKFSDASNTFLPVVCYCGSGVTACHNILAIVHAGLAPPLLYAGSWSEWITDAARPVAKGP